MPRPLCLLSQGETTHRPPAVLHLAQGSSPTEGAGCFHHPQTTGCRGPRAI